MIVDDMEKKGDEIEDDDFFSGFLRDLRDEEIYLINFNSQFNF